MYLSHRQADYDDFVEGIDLLKTLPQEIEVVVHLDMKEQTAKTEYKYPKSKEVVHLDKIFTPLAQKSLRATMKNEDFLKDFPEDLAQHPGINFRQISKGDGSILIHFVLTDHLWK